MSKKPGKAIRFKVPWQGRPRGHVDRELAPGIMQTLVDYHRAEYVEEPRKRRERTEANAEQ